MGEGYIASWIGSRYGEWWNWRPMRWLWSCYAQAVDGGWKHLRVGPLTLCQPATRRWSLEVLEVLEVSGWRLRGWSVQIGPCRPLSVSEGKSTPPQLCRACHSKSPPPPRDELDESWERSSVVQLHSVASAVPCISSFFPILQIAAIATAIQGCRVFDISLLPLWSFSRPPSPQYSPSLPPNPINLYSQPSVGCG